VSKVKK